MSYFIAIDCFSWLLLELHKAKQAAVIALLLKLKAKTELKVEPQVEELVILQPILKY